jgi:hypothetical protein
MTARHILYYYSYDRVVSIIYIYVYIGAAYIICVTLLLIVEYGMCIVYYVDEGMAFYRECNDGPAGEDGHIVAVYTAVNSWIRVIVQGDAFNRLAMLMSGNFFFLS